MKKDSGKIIYSPSDLIRYVASPFASWMDRYYLENPTAIVPDKETEDQKLIAQTGNKHEHAILEEFKSSGCKLVEIKRDNARYETLSAIEAHVPIIYQAFLEMEQFTGFADFLILNEMNNYEIWDTKFARTPKPYYSIQLCCYSEMFAAMSSKKMPEKFGIILGTKKRIEFRVEDFIYYYRRIKADFLSMQDDFTNDMKDCPEPLPNADHGRWTSHAEKFFDDTDHLVRVAGITVSQIKKLKDCNIKTMTDLANFTGKSVPKLASSSLVKLIAQASLQCKTRAKRLKDPNAMAEYEILPQKGVNDEPVGLASLPPDNPYDVFFDMEGYPLFSGGLEYLFGAYSKNPETKEFEFNDWWAHNRNEEKLAFEGFIDWVFDRWKQNPGMHIYHYAQYEVSAVRRLSTRHDTRQDEVDELLRNEVFIDLYKIVRRGLLIGEKSYSIKDVEHLYRPKRSTDVATAIDSIVQYANWMESGQLGKWQDSTILKKIRDYNEDDCKSTAELLQWLRKIAIENNIPTFSPHRTSISGESNSKELSSDVARKLEIIEKLRERGDGLSVVLADILDFHRREQKPMWWRMFDRAEATPEELRDDPGCIEGVQAVGEPTIEKQSKLQTYNFDPEQECKLSVDVKTSVRFTHNINEKFNLAALDLSEGTLQLKKGNKSLQKKFSGTFPKQGSLIPEEFVSAECIQAALVEVANKHLAGNLYLPIAALLGRVAPAIKLQDKNETPIDAAIRITGLMNGGCLVIQGPPGTGKTYMASQVINKLLRNGKKIGVASNSHKAVDNLLIECGKAANGSVQGIKAGGEPDELLFLNNPGMKHIKKNKEARNTYNGGIVGGSAWLFCLAEWEGVLDFLFIDEAGQVPLANAVAIARCAKNLILLGDHMQLEQPIQGTHPGDAGLSCLQYALKDLKDSEPDSPVFYAVVPSDYGIFLGETRRMYPSICKFISESVYEGRLVSYPNCDKQKIVIPSKANGFIKKENGVVFSGVEHDGNIQKSDEEVKRIKAIHEELIGCDYTAPDGITKPLALENFLFIAPYNAQVRALKAALPAGARVGSVDKFQGQEAPVCILSLCSSYGEYGTRSLAFILDRNRINVAISRAKCLAVIVADPRIARVQASSINEMKLINLFCKIVCI